MQIGFSFLFSGKAMLAAIGIIAVCVAALVLIRKRDWSALRDVCILLIVFACVYLGGIYVLNEKFPRIANAIRGMDAPAAQQSEAGAAADAGSSNASADEGAAAGTGSGDADAAEDDAGADSASE